MTDEQHAGSVLGAFGGSALARTAQTEGLSWIPPENPERDLTPGSPLAKIEPHHATEPASATFTTYAPPSSLALTADEVDAILERHRGSVTPTETDRADATTIPWEELDCHDRLMAIVNATNTAWWRLNITLVTGYLLRYGPGDAHREHVDMHPGSMQRKLSLSIQLSDSDDYAGGDLELRCWHGLMKMPRLRGSVVAFPGWTSHLVTPVESGERWALVVWAWGPPVR